MKYQATALIVTAIALAACASNETPPANSTAPQREPTPEEVRAALQTMVAGSGNKWMGDELNEGKIVKTAEGYQIGRWSFNTQKMRFDFVHTNRDVNPPIFFEISGPLEWNAGGKLVARVTGGMQT